MLGTGTPVATGVESQTVGTLGDLQFLEKDLEFGNPAAAKLDFRYDVLDGGEFDVRHTPPDIALPPLNATGFLPVSYRRRA
jgi:hypothetical protein